MRRTRMALAIGELAMMGGAENGTIMVAEVEIAPVIQHELLKVVEETKAELAPAGNLLDVAVVEMQNLWGLTEDGSVVVPYKVRE